MSIRKWVGLPRRVRQAPASGPTSSEWVEQERARLRGREPYHQVVSGGGNAPWSNYISCSHNNCSKKAGHLFDDGGKYDHDCCGYARHDIEHGDLRHTRPV